VLDNYRILVDNSMHLSKMGTTKMKIKIALAALFMLLFFISCEKAEEQANVKCYKCYVNYRVPMTYAYDTCVIDGQRPWRDDGYNCY
jgi:hypothetical protein